jgi:hypothetical protein
MTVLHGQEALKRMLVAEDHDFSLRSSTNPRNTYKIAWCNVPGSFYKQIKVDVLVPGIMNIPSISPTRLIWFRQNTLPSMPLLPLLLLKLQACDDHRTASYRRPDLRAKQHVDVADIDVLLVIAKNKGVHRRDGASLPASFLSSADSRVRSYTLSFPSSSGPWRALGFPNQEQHMVSRSRVLGGYRSWDSSSYDYDF